MTESTYTERILRRVLHTHSITTTELSELLDKPKTHVTGLCKRLRDRGWLVTLPGYAKQHTRWAASDRLRAEGLHAALMRNVRHAIVALVDDGVRDIGELASRVGSSHATVCSLVKRMERHGVLRRVRQNGRTYVEPWPDDLDWPLEEAA